ncbi:hypothetical protein LEP1GSC172_1349 [Leptospira noguchii]|uniref:Uncharacterized protein n=2 Tax=Leptospira noguchii TaxID=28182 RepID=T0FJD1_9LEPT|nr:hypothetical protein LEP1GSC172_1349 [Leptospira noguchii]EQA69685.1 hypothetical protein LEP1GSC059_2236 [Leptospira noguchii serovar Panama str. CZ214]
MFITSIPCFDKTKSFLIRFLMWHLHEENGGVSVSLKFSGNSK